MVQAGNCLLNRSMSAVHATSCSRDSTHCSSQQAILPARTIDVRGQGHLFTVEIFANSVMLCSGMSHMLLHRCCIPKISNLQLGFINMKIHVSYFGACLSTFEGGASPNCPSHFRWHHVNHCQLHYSCCGCVCHKLRYVHSARD